VVVKNDQSIQNGGNTSKREVKKYNILSDLTITEPILRTNGNNKAKQN